IKTKNIPNLIRNIGVVFQDFKLLPRLTVYENVTFALEVIEESHEIIRERVIEVLDLVGLKSKVKSLPKELTGGEQQRVSIARAIASKPKIVTIDEPTSNLDPDTCWEVIRKLEEINARDKTIMMSTHSREIVNTTRKRVIAIEDGIIARDDKQGEYRYEV